jgi:hypothetical protein
MRKRFLVWLAVVLTCAPMLSLAGPPQSFRKGQLTQWHTFEIRSDLDFQHAWDAAFDILINNFDLAMVLKDEGYIRTEWLYSYFGRYDHEYRLRVTVRFTPDKRNVRVKAEAQIKDGDDWLIGVDEQLVNTLKTDLMGTVGRTTR